MAAVKSYASSSPYWSLEEEQDKCVSFGTFHVKKPKKMMDWTCTNLFIIKLKGITQEVNLIMCILYISYPSSKLACMIGQEKKYSCRYYFVRCQRF